MGLQTEIAKITCKRSGGEWDNAGEFSRTYYTTTADTIIAKMREVVEGVENPYGGDVHLDAGVYDGLYRERFEEARQAILRTIKED